MSLLDAATRVAGVLGHPIGHSLSPAIHNAALRHDGVNAVYLAFDVPGEAFPAAIGGLRALGAAGANVTIPHKEAAFAIADLRSAEAERVGAANTLVLGERVEAHNTDVLGVRTALEQLGARPSGGPALLLGAGGAAAAAAWALLDAGAEELLVTNRTPDRADELAARVGPRARPVPWDDRDRAAASAAVIVNATALGLHGEEAPLSAEGLAEAAVAGCRGVLDLVYARGETALVRTARDCGLVSSDGALVLVHQGAAAYRLLWGRPAPVAVMLEAAAAALGRLPSPGWGTEPPPIA